MQLVMSTTAALIEQGPTTAQSNLENVPPIGEDEGKSKRQNVPETFWPLPFPLSSPMGGTFSTLLCAVLGPCSLEHLLLH